MISNQCLRFLKIRILNLFRVFGFRFSLALCLISCSKTAQREYQGLELGPSNGEIISISKNSSAGKSELKKGDRIVNIDGETVVNWNHEALMNALRAQKGKELRLAVERDILVTIINIPRTTKKGLGVKIETVPEGITITDVTKDSASYIAGLKTGDIITEIAEKSLKGMKMSDVIEIIKQNSSGKMATVIRRNIVLPVAKAIIKAPVEGKQVSEIKKPAERANIISFLYLIIMLLILTVVSLAFLMKRLSHGVTMHMPSAGHNTAVIENLNEVKLDEIKQAIAGIQQADINLSDLSDKIAEKLKKNFQENSLDQDKLVEKIKKGMEISEKQNMPDFSEIDTKIEKLHYEINRMFEKANAMAITDKQTGLFNDEYYREYLNEELKRAAMYEYPCSIVRFDVDNLDVYSKTFGEDVKNEILRKVASVLKENVRNIDKIARWKDASFSIVLPKTNKKVAASFAERTQKAIASEPMTDEKNMIKDTKVTVIAGAVSSPIDGSGEKELSEKLSQVIEQARKKGITG